MNKHQPALMIALIDKAVKKAKERDLGGDKVEPHDEVSDEVKHEDDEGEPPNHEEEMVEHGKALREALQANDDKGIMEALHAAIQWCEMNPDYEEEQA